MNQHIAMPYGFSVKHDGMLKYLIVLLLLCSLFVAGCWQDNQQEQEDGGALRAPTATFSNASIVTGYTLPVAASTIQSGDVTLTIRPPAAAANVIPTIAGVNRATIVNIRRAAGSITFNVKGTSATPANMPNGDTFVEARLGNQVLARANIVVVIPTVISRPHPTFNGNVNGTNIIMDTNSSPAFFGVLLPTDVRLATTYITFLKITVDDQFGSPLDPIYAGTPVTEQGGFMINQAMQANGTYQDPVGLVLVQRMAVPRENPAGTDNPQLAAHLAAAPAAPRNFNETQTKLVQVGGHSLNQGVTNRKVTVSTIAGSNTKAQLVITWP